VAVEDAAAVVADAVVEDAVAVEDADDKRKEV